MAERVLIAGNIHQDGLRLFEQREGLSVEITEAVDEATLAGLARDVSAILVRSARINAAVIDSAPHLKVVSRHGVGFNSVDIDALTARGIPLAIAVGGNAVSVAEHTFYLILALTKHGGDYDAAARHGDFSYRSRPLATEVSGKSLLVIGFGRIGTRVAARALAFDMKVLVYDPYVDPKTIRAGGYTEVTDLQAVLPGVDILTIHCPLNAETTGLISGRELEAMQSSAILINTARGGVVDETALYTALTHHTIAAAGIDVFVTEPTVQDDPLLTLDNVIVSPHCAGVTRESSSRTSRIAAQNVLSALDGTIEPEFVVNTEVLEHA